jgi:hypothetical protein
MIFGYNQSGNHPANNLATFGYIINMKAEKEKITIIIILIIILVYSWLATFWKLSEDSGDLEFFLKFEIWRNWVIVLPRRIQMCRRNHVFSGRNLAKTAAAPAAIDCPRVCLLQ